MGAPGIPAASALLGVARAMHAQGRDLPTIETYLQASNIVRRDALPSDHVRKIAESVVNGEAPPPAQALTEGPIERYQLLSADEIADMPPAAHRVKNVLPNDGVAAIFGAYSSGKSFLGQDLAYAIAEGRPQWFGYRVEPCEVVYIVLEGRGGQPRRARAYRMRHPGADRSRIRFVTAPFQLLDGVAVQVLISTLTEAGLKPGVIFIDTLSAATAGVIDENTGDGMGRAIAATKQIQEAIGGLVVLIHHAGKDPAKGMRGHTSLPASLDTIIEVSRNANGRRWTLYKVKDGEDGKEHTFRLDVVEVGVDVDGDPETSCVVVQDEEPAVLPRRVSVPSGGNQKIVWEGLGELFMTSPHWGKAGAPPTRPCVELEAAVEMLKGRLATDPKRRVERTREAITGLINKRLLNLQEGWLWCE